MGLFLYVVVLDSRPSLEWRGGSIGSKTDNLSQIIIKPHIKLTSPVSHIDYNM